MDCDNIEEIFDNTGVSPVIGIILIVAITVGLVALASTIVFDIGSDVSETADSTIDLSESSDGLKATVIRNDNVEEFRLEGPNDRVETFDSDSGSSVLIGDGEGTYRVISVKPDGNEEVIRTIDIDESSPVSDSRTATDEQTGTVSTNPPIEGAIVESIEDGSVIDSTTTNENGEYILGASKDAYINVTVDGALVNIDSNERPFYGNKTVDSNIEGSLDIELEAEESTINNSELYVSYDKTSDGVKKISTLEQLQAINEIENGSSQDYKLVNDIDASETINWGDTFDEYKETVGNMTSTDEEGTKFELLFTNIEEITEVKSDGEPIEVDLIDSTDGIIELKEDTEQNINITYTFEEERYKGFNPIGDIEGHFNGNGYDISGININRPSESRTAVFSVITGEVRDLSLVDVDITGGSRSGGFVSSNNGDIINSSIDGEVQSDSSEVGGFVSQNYNYITESSADVTVYSTGDFAAGFAGENLNKIDKSYSKGKVSSTGSYTAGFVGNNRHISPQPIIKNSYSHTDVKVLDDGSGAGFIGLNQDSFDNNGIIINTFSTGEVINGEGFAVVNMSGAEIDKSYWDIESSGQTSSSIGVGLTTSEMQGDSLNEDFENDFDFTDIWNTNVDPDGYPKLQWEE